MAAGNATSRHGRTSKGWHRAVFAVCLLVAASLTAAGRPTGAQGSGRPFATPIQHVVLILQENHSFDNVLGALCAQATTRAQPCDGVTTGALNTGEVIPLARAGDFVPEVLHTGDAQTTAIDNGKMDGYSLIVGCTGPQHVCYSQYQPSQIPNVAALANRFVISDRTFEDAPKASWGSHLSAIAGTLDGFVAGIPHYGRSPLRGPGWGCDSGDDAGWSTATGRVIQVPSCVPKPDGTGPYRASPVAYTPTIMDRVSGARLNWKLYVGLPGGLPGNQSGYGWAICPTFAECIYGSKKRNMVANGQIISDATKGTLPNFAVVTPNQLNSQHNGDSMTVGDNWIGQVVSAIEHGPDWSSTAIFISWDDCGCFYDHVPPPSGTGIRLPMLIVSPYARPVTTDSNPASFASVLAFTESVFGLTPLTANDATAYNYLLSFDFTQPPLAPVPMTQTSIPAAEQHAIDANPPDPNDPT